MHSQAKLQLNLCWGDDLEINIKENQSGEEEKFSSRASISDNEASQAKNAQFKLESVLLCILWIHSGVILSRSHAIRAFVKITNNSNNKKYLMIATKNIFSLLDRCKSQF